MSRSRWICWLAAALVVAVAAAGVEAVDKVDVTFAGRYDTAGDADGVFVSGNYAYVADGSNGLVIVDVGNPEVPTLAGSYDTRNAIAVFVSGNYAYVADGYTGLVIVDVRSPEAPVLAGRYDTEGDAYGVFVSGNYAYVADGSNGLVIVDVSNPAVPVLAGSYDTEGDAYGVFVSGNYAYVADGSNGLVIVDISNKETPMLAGRYEAGNVQDVFASDNHAYVAYGSNGLLIVDVRSPEAPVLAGRYDTAGYAEGIAVSGNHAYVADGSNGLLIVDVRSPEAPVLAGRYETENVQDVFVSGNHAYVACGSDGIAILCSDMSGIDTTSTPSVRILGLSSSVRGGEDLEVRVGWSNIPADWELIVELARSKTDEEDQTRLADDARRTVSGSGERIFKLNVHSVKKTYDRAVVWAFLLDENYNWTDFSANRDITVRPSRTSIMQGPTPTTWTLVVILLLLIIFAGAFYATKKRGGMVEPENVKSDRIESEPQPLRSIVPCSTDQFTTLRTIWDPSIKDFVWDAGKPDEYGELPRIKQWIEGNNPNIYWFLLKIVNHADHPVTEWNVTLYTEQALTILEAHLDKQQVRIVKSDFDTDSNRNVCVVAIPPEFGVSIPANGGRRSMYFKMDIRCEDALKMEFGVSGVAKLGKSPQVEVPIREKRFTYACKYGDFRNMYYESIDALASMAVTNLQESYSREIVQNFTNSFRLIREFENYCNDRYAESEILIGKLEVVRSSLKAAEPITKDEILPLVDKELGALQRMGAVEGQKERGIRMCEQLIELLHIATSRVRWGAASGE